MEYVRVYPIGCMKACRCIEKRQGLTLRGLLTSTRGKFMNRFRFCESVLSRYFS